MNLRDLLNYKHPIHFGLLAMAGWVPWVNAAEESLYELSPFEVTTGLSQRSVDEYALPVDLVHHSEIHRKGGASLGAILDDRLGVTASSFSAGASRPIIRGFDGPRVLILDSGIEAVDVASPSPDHAVATEGLLVERVEILRGPASLLYGSSAIGGVVNVIERKYPKNPMENPLEGEFSIDYTQSADGMESKGILMGGNDTWAFAISGLQRRFDDYTIPKGALFAEEAHSEDEHGHEEGHEDEHEPYGESLRILENSFVETDVYSIGGSYFISKNQRFSMAFSGYESLYGVPGHEHHHEDEEHEGHEDHHDEHLEHDEEEGVSIRLKRKRVDGEFEWTDIAYRIEDFRLRYGYTDYQHLELEGDEIGTRFAREVWDLRAELTHRLMPVFEDGLLGAQWQVSEFDAIGDEAFTPKSNTEMAALFMTQHLHQGNWHFELGGRIEYQDIEANAISRNYNDLAYGMSSSVIYRLNPKQSIGLTLQRSQRHPTSTELYADGPHLATSQYELGDADLGLETSVGSDLYYRYRSENLRTELSVFYSRFDDMILPLNQGAEVDELPLYQFSAVDAEYYGGELGLDYRVWENGERDSLWAGIRGDWVKANDLSNKTPLPRIPPARLGIQFEYLAERFRIQGSLRHVFSQGTTAPFETKTGSYELVNLRSEYTWKIGEQTEWSIYLSGDNLLDEVIRYHTSFLKEESPQPGRSYRVGMQVAF